uniref:Uncharacterized AAA domain-containing protein ycf46 n=1 Tax=Bornetia secundiflora TaxID=2575637 RepID=A0A4D6WT38_9FLOR|nr:hypothetical protein [Bornetia secundiflora]
MNFEKKIIALLSSRNCFIYIKTYEEDRLEYTLNYLSNNILINQLYSWDFIDGYKNIPNEAHKAIRNPLEALNFIQSFDLETQKIFLLKDFDNFMNDISIIRKLKNLYLWLNTSNSSIIISAQDINIPSSIQRYFSSIDFPLPNYREITEELNRLIKIFNIQKEIPLENITSAYQGFPIDRIRKSFAKIATHDMAKINMISCILQEKKEIIEQNNILEFYPSYHKLSDIGGLKNLKMWLKKRSLSLSIKAQNYGLPNPKGILLVGIQGTGKSMSAKAISLEWQLPLLKLDMGKIFAGIIGESESRMRQMILLSEQISPCVLWIDEIDKIFTKSNSNTDSGTTNRVMNNLITWLSEKNNNVFVVATANNISSLPLEILRRGRFDEIFFLDLPKFEERLNIFQIHLQKFRPLTWHTYNIYYLSKISYQFSGAEIEQAIIEAMHNAFYECREFNTEDIIYAINDLVPIAFIDEYTINNLQELAHVGKVRLA